MPCAMCGDIIPTTVARCPACGTWARYREFRALGIAVFMLLGFHAFIALSSGISLIRLARPLTTSTSDSYDAGSTTRELASYSDAVVISSALAAFTGMLYLSWLWRAHRQAANPRRYHRAWVIAGWLCPVLNLWLPALLVHDVWVNSGRHRPAERHWIGTVVTAWWVSLLGAGSLLLLFPHSAASTLTEARFAVHLGIAATAVQALAATLCMATVFQITRLQIDHA
ncbi:MAG: DUF4328 domain-containing protein [Actinomadura sp.]